MSQQERRALAQVSRVEAFAAVSVPRASLVGQCRYVETSLRGARLALAGRGDTTFGRALFDAAWYAIVQRLPQRVLLHGNAYRCRLGLAALREIVRRR